MRVMIVDDSSEMRQLIRQTLAPWIPEIVECSDGDEVVRRFDEFHPDWTLMDYRMKRVDGLAAIRQLREHCPSARILLLTAYESTAVRQQALALGAIRCLSKDELLELPGCIGFPTHPPVPRSGSDTGSTEERPEGS
ncbi:MAG: response regulator transcription factor [Verrucomicrobiales bacterium]|nr:response regulator transcription factor [Verrucomicrobiales bacterium]